MLSEEALFRVPQVLSLKIFKCFEAILACVYEFCLVNAYCAVDSGESAVGFQSMTQDESKRWRDIR